MISQNIQNRDLKKKEITGGVSKTPKYHNFDETLKITRFVISKHATTFENHSILQNCSIYPILKK